MFEEPSPIWQKFTIARLFYWAEALQTLFASVLEPQTKQGHVFRPALAGRQWELVDALLLEAPRLLQPSSPFFGRFGGVASFCPRRQTP